MWNRVEQCRGVLGKAVGRCAQGGSPTSDVACSPTVALKTRGNQKPLIYVETERWPGLRYGLTIHHQSSKYATVWYVKFLRYATTRSGMATLGTPHHRIKNPPYIRADVPTKYQNWAHLHATQPPNLATRTESLHTKRCFLK